MAQSTRRNLDAIDARKRASDPYFDAVRPIEREGLHAAADDSAYARYQASRQVRLRADACKELKKALESAEPELATLVMSGAGKCQRPHGIYLARVGVDAVAKCLIGFDSDGNAAGAVDLATARAMVESPRIERQAATAARGMRR